MNLVAEQGSMIVTWADDDIIRVTHTAKDAHKPCPSRRSDDPNALTPRELETLGCIVNGDTNEEIGARMKISAVTAKFHVTNLMKKLGAKNRVVCAVMALRNSLVP